MDTAPHPAHPGQPHAHAETPMRVYYSVFAALMVLLVLTVWVAYIHLAHWGLPIAMTIAVVKASLVVWYFMHLRQTGKVMWLFAGVGVVWLITLIVSVVVDVLMRGR